MQRWTRIAFVLIVLVVQGISAGADPPAEELLSRVRTTALTLRTLTADVDQIVESSKGRRSEWTGTLEVERPNRMRLELRDKNGPGGFTEIWDGHSKWQFGEPGNSYRKSALAADTTAYFPGTGWPGYYAPSYEDLLGDAEQAFRSLGKQTVDDRVCDVLEMVGQLQTVRWYVGLDYRIYRHEETRKEFSFSDPETLVLSHIQEGVAIPDADFTFKPGDRHQETLLEHPDLIAVGHAAPTLSLPLASGGLLRLADLYRGKKALLVFSINYPS